ERYFGGARKLGARIVDEGEAEAVAVALPAPVGHAGDGLHHLAPARRVPEQLEPERHRIDPALHRDLVDEGLGRELVGGEPDGAPRGGARSSSLVQLLVQLMRHVVAGKIGAVHQDAVLAAAALVAHGVEERRYAVTSETMVPGDEPARRVEAGAQEVPGE